MQNELPQPRLKDLIKPTNTPNEFEKIVGQLLSPNTKKALGEHPEKVASEAILCTTVFAASPGTFDRKAYAFTLGALPHETAKIDAAIELCKNNGVFEENQNGRFEIKDTELQATLKEIFSRYN